MLFRAVVLGLVAVSLSGCFPPAFQVVSWTASGLSYMFSGRGLGDHALSLVTEKDCATWRILQGKRICVDFKKEYKNRWEAVASTFKVPDPEALFKPDEDKASGTALAVIPATRDIEGEILAFSAAGVQPQTSEERNVIDIAASLDAIAPAAGPAGAPNAMRDGDGQQVSQETATQSRGGDAISIYLVVGSFSDNARAKTLQAAHASFPSRVWNARVGEKSVYRVLVGPVVREALDSARAGLVKAGLRHSWAVRLCAVALSPPPCAQPPLQQAKLK